MFFYSQPIKTVEHGKLLPKKLEQSRKIEEPMPICKFCLLEFKRCELNGKDFNFFRNMAKGWKKIIQLSSYVLNSSQSFKFREKFIK